MRIYKKSYRPSLGTLFLVLIATAPCAYGQFTNDTNIFVPTGIEVHINGDVNNSGFIQNQGDMHVTGNWRNTNIYQGLGRINMQGTSAQTFFNNTNPVYSLAINGGGAKHIEDKISITQRLDLTLGTVFVRATDELTLSESALVTGGSSRSYVDGPLIYEGTGYKFFPIGKNGAYYPVELLDVKGINIVTQMEVFDVMPPFSLPSSTQLFSSVYWERKALNGTFLNSPIALGHPIPDGYTDDHALDILQSQDQSNPFTPLGNINVDYGVDPDNITTGREATGTLFVIGQGEISDGSVGQFYLSTSLSSDAIDPDNRFVRVFGDQLSEDDFQFTVYNRWGLKVYESKSLDQMSSTGWDGHQQAAGNPLPSGAYPFIFRAKKLSGEVIEQKGVISIIR